MYFPFLRGKQFELLALKEACALLKPNSKIHPIIEPVKNSYQALGRSLEELCCNSIHPTVIVNPMVGDMSNGDTAKLNSFFSEFLGSNKAHVGIVVDTDFSLRRAYSVLERFYNDDTPITLICTSDDIDDSLLKEFIGNRNVEFSLIDNDKVKSRSFKRLLPPNTKVLLTDPFNKRDRNADYAKKVDSTFTEDHIYYREEGFIGFSDYLTIGEGFSDSGFLPYAVAIHLTYPANNGQAIRIHHFVSESNDDDSNVAGKFFEALKGMMEFVEKLPSKTYAIKEFERLYKEEHYPGLGYIKKLSILNHLELVNHLLQS